MNYGGKTDKIFSVRMNSKEYFDLINKIKKLGLSRRQFLLIALNNYVVWENQNQKRLLRKRLRDQSKAALRIGKRRFSGVLPRMCREARARKMESDQTRNKDLQDLISIIK